MIELSNKIYTGTIIGFLYTMFIFHYFIEEKNITFQIILIGLFGLVPLVNYIFSYIYKTSEKYKISKEDLIFQLLCLLGCSALTLILSDFHILTNITLLLLFFGITFKTDERYYFLCSIICLSITFICISSKNHELGYFWGNYTFYFLLIGFFIHFSNKYLHKNIKIHEESKSKRNKYLHKIISISSIFHFISILYILGVILCIYQGKTELIVLISYLFFPSVFLYSLTGANLFGNIFKKSSYTIFYSIIGIVISVIIPIAFFPEIIYSSIILIILSVIIFLIINNYKQINIYFQQKKELFFKK